MVEGKVNERRFRVYPQFAVRQRNKKLIDHKLHEFVYVAPYHHTPSGIDLPKKHMQRILNTVVGEQYN